MTKKHYIAIAATIKQDVDSAARLQNPEVLATMQRMANYACETFAQVAREDNPRFDHARFRKACGLDA